MQAVRKGLQSQQEFSRWENRLRLSQDQENTRKLTGEQRVLAADTVRVQVLHTVLGSSEGRHCRCLEK